MQIIPRQSPVLYFLLHAIRQGVAECISGTLESLVDILGRKNHLDKADPELK